MAFTVMDLGRLIGNPVDFFNNVAICSINPSVYTPTVQNMPDDLTLVEATPSTAFSAAGGAERSVRMFTLKMAASAAEKRLAFKAYIVTYEQGQTRLTTLGQDADLCFTANMNGCTFGIGNQNTAGDALSVTHGNASGNAALGGLLGGDKTRAIQSSVQYTAARDALGVGARVFEPEHYRSGGTNRCSLTFGWRQPGQKWGFYSLVSERPGGGKIVTQGVNPVGTNQITEAP